jgi:ribosomal protein S18 acetylase RimI-like enzyme
MSTSAVVIRVADPDSTEDLASIRMITNEAFMADAFFKIEKYHLRFDETDVTRLISAENSVFMLASVADFPDEIVGSIHLEISYDNNLIAVGHFSAVSVASKCGRRGIGKALVRAAEEYTIATVLKRVQDETSTCTIFMEMGVINLREDLFPWYESQGYTILEPFLSNNEELTRIVLPGLQVHLILMRKVLIDTRMMRSI